VDEMVAQITPGNNWRYFQYDARGHCTLQTDGSGDIMEQYDYDAFGFPYFYDRWGNTIGSSTWGNRFLFTGPEWISELRTYDFRNRMYQPELGRFMQPDPKQFAAGDYNLYRYCHNDPVNRSDPMGLLSPEAHDKVFDNALKDRFSASDLAKVKQASREFDKATQATKFANMHAMRKAGQSPEEAKAETQKFIQSRLGQARAAESFKLHDEALKLFGEAMHPVGDRSSSEHTNPDGNPKPYYGLISILGHSPNDYIGRETSATLTPALLQQQSSIINSAADYVFGPR
jgi:RHS repeat-associated protein